MNFIETYGCKKNSGLKNLGVSSGLDDVLSLDENASLDVYSDDVKEFWQHYEKEIRDIINRKDEKEKFDEICRFLKEQQTFEYFLNNADKDCNRKYYFISFWNVIVLFQQKDIARFDISKENLYLNYCKLIDKISDGAFEDFGENHMEGNYNAYDDPEWLCEEVAQIVMLPNGWFVCECDNVFLDDTSFCQYLYYDENLLYVGTLRKPSSDVVESFFEFQNSEDYKNHETEKILKIQTKYEKEDIDVTSLDKVDCDNLVCLYKRQITDIRDYIYRSNCKWIQKCCETISIIAQQLWKVDRNKIKLSNSIERDLNIDNVAKEQLLKELEEVFNIKLDEYRFMETDTIKDVFELVVHAMEKSEKKEYTITEFLINALWY